MDKKQKLPALTYEERSQCFNIGSSFYIELGGFNYKFVHHGLVQLSLCDAVREVLDSAVTLEGYKTFDFMDVSSSSYCSKVRSVLYDQICKEFCACRICDWIDGDEDMCDRFIDFIDDVGWGIHNEKDENKMIQLCKYILPKYYSEFIDEQIGILLKKRERSN